MHPRTPAHSLIYPRTPAHFLTHSSPHSIALISATCLAPLQPIVSNNKMTGGPGVGIWVTNGGEGNFTNNSVQGGGVSVSVREGSRIDLCRLRGRGRGHRLPRRPTVRHHCSPCSQTKLRKRILNRAFARLSQNTIDKCRFGLYVGCAARGECAIPSSCPSDCTPPATWQSGGRRRQRRGARQHDHQLRARSRGPQAIGASTAHSCKPI